MLHVVDAECRTNGSRVTAAGNTAGQRVEAAGFQRLNRQIVGVQGATGHIQLGGYGAAADQGRSRAGNSNICGPRGANGAGENIGFIACDNRQITGQVNIGVGDIGTVITAVVHHANGATHSGLATGAGNAAGNRQYRLTRDITAVEQVTRSGIGSA